MKKLNELYPGFPEIEIKDIKINSKEVEAGDIFVCTQGVTADRHDFIEEAVQNGASALIVSKDVTANVPCVKVENTNKELPLLASRLYDHPEKELELIAVTGTNGKTTVASIIQDMMGNDICGYLGTNGIRCQKFQESIKNTTPDSDRLYKYFRRLVDGGCRYLSMETSSESFYRNRLEHLEFEIGIITNITEDHLNIHKTIENYVACKKQLLTKIKPNGYAILNTDDSHFEECKEEVKCNLLTYGKTSSTLQIIDVKVDVTKTLVTVRHMNKDYQIVSPLLGEFNVYNLCAAILVFIALGYHMEEIIPRIERINPPAGRVQFLNYGQDYKIVLDYAHTPDAFLKIFPLLKTLKQNNRIITVTGSAGGREKEKRGPMGNIVLENSEHVIFTMDDPRTESVDEIIDDLVSRTTNQNYERVLDRKQAIYKAFEMAKKDDIIFIAGKGTDNYMALGTEYLPYSDLETIEEYFKEKV